VHSLSRDSIDDLLRDVIELAVGEGIQISPSKGDALDLVGVQLALAQPRARISRTETRGRVFSALGELAWYLSGSNDIDFIEYYLRYYSDLDEHGKAHGGYGPRLFGSPGAAGQVHSIVEALRRSPHTRKAVIQLFDHEDLVGDHLDIPCTCTLQFLVRNEQLDLVTYMRSNDIHKGMPHDLFSFTMIQELVARSIGVDLGTYYHFVGSLHLYESDIGKARRFLSEGWQSSMPMEAMPDGDPWGYVADFLSIERELRLDGYSGSAVPSIHPYWDDLARLLAIYRLSNEADFPTARELASTLNSAMLRTYALDRFDRNAEN
jgi:thymidylate synthase